MLLKPKYVFKTLMSKERAREILKENLADNVFFIPDPAKLFYGTVLKEDFRISPTSWIWGRRMFLFHTCSGRMRQNDLPSQTIVELNFKFLLLRIAVLLGLISAGIAWVYFSTGKQFTALIIGGVIIAIIYLMHLARAYYVINKMIRLLELF